MSSQFPRIHPREELVKAHEQKIRDVLLAAAKELTEAEIIRAVVTCFGDYLGSMAKYMIRAERHPNNPDKPGGWE